MVGRRCIRVICYTTELSACLAELCVFGEQVRVQHNLFGAAGGRSAQQHGAGCRRALSRPVSILAVLLWYGFLRPWSCLQATNGLLTGAD